MNVAKNQVNDKVKDENWWLGDEKLNFTREPASSPTANVVRWRDSVWDLVGLKTRHQSWIMKRVVKISFVFSAFTKEAFIILFIHPYTVKKYNAHYMIMMTIVIIPVANNLMSKFLKVG